jgi:hypothetical protein
MLKDNLVGLIMPIQSCGTQALGNEFTYRENPRSEGAVSLTGRCSSPLQTEPRQEKRPSAAKAALLGKQLWQD